MNTVAHIIVASAVFARREAHKRNWVVLLAALIPDFSMFIFFAWSRLMGWSGAETWNVRYWTEPWQTVGAASNSFVLAGGVLAIAIWRKWTLVAIACGAVLVHLALDLPLHADDAHRHFWPLTDWRFFSPISYWDPRSNGLIGAGIETGIVVIACAALWSRFRASWARGLVAFIALAQVLLFTAFVAFSDRIGEGAGIERPHSHEHPSSQPS
jgi:hypothetical protein